MPSLYGEASSLLQGATRTRQGDDELALRRQQLREERDVQTAQAISGGLTKGAEQFLENKRTAATNAATLERERIQQAGATQREQAQIEAQFVTITPQLAKGAIGITGDNGWNDLIGQKMRVDVYSGLLSSAARMAEANQPKTFKAREGDQEFEFEYDPRTRTAKRLTAGGEAFSPDQKDGSKVTGTKLNPFTLQNIVKADEKTLLTQLGGKGAKGIPEAGLFDKLVGKIGGQELSEKEQAKLATLRSLATRLKNNYVNLANLETERGLNPTQVDPQVMEVIDKLLEEKTPPPTTVRVKTKSGKIFDIPADKVEEALKRGATKVTK